MRAHSRRDEVITGNYGLPVQQNPSLMIHHLKIKQNWPEKELVLGQEYDRSFRKRGLKGIGGGGGVRDGLLIVRVNFQHGFHPLYAK